MHQPSLDSALFERTSGIHPSFWLEEPPNSLMTLGHDIQTDVCIIGAGIAGLSIAYHLAKLGKNVTVIEAKEIGSGETGRTTAHLSNAFDDRYAMVMKVHGQEIANLVAESHTKAIDSIERIVLDENISCDFKRVDGYLFLDTHDTKNTLNKEEKAALHAGINVSVIDSPQVMGFKDQPVLHFPNQAQFHPLKYLNGLTRAILKNNGKIYIRTAALKINEGNTIQIETSQGFTVSAKNLVIATNAPIFDKSFSFAKQESNRTYVIAGLIPKDSLQYALYWDTADPYHYVRLQPYNDDADLVIIGGEDHRTGQKFSNEKNPFKQLESWYQQIFPPLKEVMYQWSGQVQEPCDYLAFIGRTKTKERNIFIVTGDSGNGMTHGALAGLLIRDLILKKENPWEKAYNPHRSPFKNIQALIKHNVEAVGNFFRFLVPAFIDFKSESDEAQIQGWRKVARFKNNKGNLCESRAICTHMNAPLRWNPIEKTWDCPAHGSRFSSCGKVIQGPANQSLNQNEDVR